MVITIERQYGSGGRLVGESWPNYWDMNSTTGNCSKSRPAKAACRKTSSSILMNGPPTVCSSARTCFPPT